MIAKELLDGRWKLMGGLVLGLGTVVASVILPQTLQNEPNPEVRATLLEATRDYPAYLWSSVFNPVNGVGLLLLLLAALIGASLIAGEVSRGTIFVLLSRPLRRDRILLTKYAVGAALLLVVVVSVTVAVLALTAASGHPQHVGGTLVSALLLWLGTLFVLGVATLFSVLMGDVLRPLALTGVITLLLATLPSLFGVPGLTLPSYWTSFPAFLGQGFPLQHLLVSVVAALLPLLAALALFRRQQY